MTTRVDYWDDPAAPRPNRVVPGASVLAVDDRGRVLLQRRRDSGHWALPGGMMEIGETLSAAAVRETHEETGIRVEVTNIVGVFTDPRHVIAYAHGEARQEFTVVFGARPVGGRLAASDESTDVGWFPLSDLDRLPMHSSMRRRLAVYVDGTAPYFD